MKFKSFFIAAFAVALSCAQAFGQATLLPPGEQCFQATTGINGMVGVLGTITGGSLYTTGTYAGVALTGGSGTTATANITVSGGVVSAVTILNPGINYVVGDVLSAAAASIGGTGSGFSVPVSSTSINSSLAGGTVAYYIPNTLTFKQTWQDSAQTILNTNPVNLDQNGCAIVYGAGAYRQILKDSLSNTVWDQLTAATTATSIFWAGQAGGTPNAITITDPSFANGDGSMIQFLALSENTGPTTISVSSGSPISVVKDTSTGPVALSGGEIGPNDAPLVTYDQINAVFHLLNPAVTSSGSGSSASLTSPQGYLNLVGQATGDVVQTGDVVSAVTVYYSPFVGNQLPIWNGSSFVEVTFTELTATLTSSGSPASTIQDECVFSNNGVPTLVTGPSWTTVAAGAGNRGSGAGTAQLTRLNGIWVNANSIIGYNGISTYNIAANQCTYVGSISVDGTAGQVSAYRTWGQSRKFGIWNAYNRQPIVLLAGDSTASWNYAAATIRASNGNFLNSVTVFAGLPEEEFSATFTQKNTILIATGTSFNAAVQIGIGWNSTTAFSGQTGTGQFSYSSASPATIGATVTNVANYVNAPAIGTNVVTALESGNTSGGVEFGTNANMQLQAAWRG